MLNTNYMQELIGLEDVIVTKVERKDNQLDINLIMPNDAEPYFLNYNTQSISCLCIFLISSPLSSRTF
jgi:hypothetical protein